jgi:hypothetical protein
MKRKGAIQLSLGFIVAVVFAVVLLSLAIVWLRGVFIGFGSLTNDLTQQAHTELEKTFRQTTSNFAVWPSRYELQPGTTLILSAGIKNNDPEGKSLYFIVNLQPSATDAIGATTSQMIDWVTVPQEPTWARPNEVAYRDITINIPANAPHGNYIYDVLACFSESSGMIPESCTIESGSLWSSPQPLTLTVKG